ncbi:MAG TPA: PorP/SprF family type IX secretion system membrane protein [Bacteroidia bacterium]|jgi:type IX secretion system PorP/SprF family membrane protein|nr:PorP/SprF family type IX secretion system membrane protein [Bacteroidia bacterium]
MNKLTFCFLVFVLAGNTLFAQDPVFSQAYANPLYLNPAFAGTGTSQHIGLNFRDQWENIPGTFVTYNVSYDRNIIDSSNAIGILANQDRAGGATLITDNISIIYAHQFHIKSFTLSLGMQGTYHEKIVDWSKLTFGDMIDPTRGFVYSSGETSTRTSIAVPDFSAGALGYWKNVFLGFAVDHLTQPDESFITGASPLPMKFVFNAGGNIQAGSFTVTPTFLYQKQQDFDMEVAECYLSKGHIEGAIGYRFGDAMIFILGYQNSFIRIGYSYDLTTSQLGIQSGGCHEASLAILMPYKKDRLKKVNGINCPHF